MDDQDENDSALAYQQELEHQQFEEDTYGNKVQTK